MSERLYRGYVAVLAALVTGSMLYAVAADVLAPALVSAAGHLGLGMAVALWAFGLGALSMWFAKNWLRPWLTRPEATWLDAVGLVRRRTRTRALWGVAWLLMLCGLTVPIALGGWGLSQQAAWLLGVTAGVIAAGLIAGAAPRTSPPPLWDLHQAGDLREALTTSAFLLETSPLQLHRNRTHTGSSRRLPTTSLVWLSIARSQPFAWALAGVAVAMLPTVATIWGPEAASLALVTAAYTVSLRTTRQIDALVDSPALRRTLAHHPARAELTAVAALLPLLLAAGGTLLARLPWLVAGIALATAGAGWLRRTAARRPSQLAGAALATPLGIVPVDLALRLTAGLDVLLVGLFLAAQVR